MSLIKIRRESSDSKKSSSFSGLNLGGGHFTKLRKEKKSSGFNVLERQKADEKPYKTEEANEPEDAGPKHVVLWVEPKNRNKDIFVIALIAIAVISLIVVELIFFSGGKEEVPPQIKPNVTINDTPPLVVNDTKIKLPDLDIKSMSVTPTKPAMGDRVSVLLSVKNSGAANASNVTVAISMGVVNLNSTVIDLLEPKETVNLVINWTVLAGYQGEYDIKAYLDPNHTIVESSETNNEETREIDIQELMISDVTANFTMKSKESFDEYWYSDRYRHPPTSGENYQYFQLSKQSDQIYYLDVAIAGFFATKSGQTLDLKVPDSSTSGWNSGWCMKETISDAQCIWNGPRFDITLEIKSSKLIAEDMNGKKSSSATAEKSVKAVKLIGLKKATWPGTFKTWKVANAPEPDKLIPANFFDYSAGHVYIYPMKWNPKSNNAEVALWYRFEVKVD